MDGHAARKAGRASAGVAPDVAFSATWSGAANTDARYYEDVEVAELPWPLRFYFLPALEPNGNIRWACVGYTVGDQPVDRAADAGLDLDIELTAERKRILRQNLDRYQLMAQRQLIPTPENREYAQRIRQAGKRKKRERWTMEAKIDLVREYRALQGDPNGRIWTLAERHDVSRTSIYRVLKRAEADGLLDPGEVPRRERNR